MTLQLYSLMRLRCHDAMRLQWFTILISRYSTAVMLHNFNFVMLQRFAVWVL
jgi:hypothetical protein